MHEAIQHVGAMLRLDCWRLEALAKNAEMMSLDAFAKSEPSWDELVAMANLISTKYVANANKITSLRNSTSGNHDEQYENTLILQHYLLLYEETSFAMNAGDIGRLESLYCLWIWIFSICGKNKYAAELRTYLEDVHFIYPSEIRFP